MYSFFGQNTKLDLQNSDYKAILLTELKNYATNQTNADLIITDNWTDFTFQVLGNNPKSHFFYENSIHIKEKMMDVAFVFSETKKLIKIYFKLHTAPNYFRKTLRKWLNMQFTNRNDNITQIFHENVLIPMTFFIDNLAPIHASGFAINKKGVLLGGTGGVGKTTLELDNCLDKKATFITDDIAIVNNKQQVYPNLNQPKIYGYNLVGNQKLTQIVFKKLSLINKLHWFLHKNIFGVDKVRRKISANELYPNVAKGKTELHTYYILLKRNCKSITKTNIAKKEAIKTSLNVIKTEYNYFFNHIKWHEFNAVLLNKKPVYTMLDLEKKWTSVLNETFENANVQVLHIPIDYTHQEFKKQMQHFLFVENK